MLAISVYLAVVAIFIGIRKYQESKWLKCLNDIKLTNKVAIVTGANSGIGYEIAKNLAKRQAEVVLACRNLQAANRAIDKIRRETSKAILVAMELDLASLKSIKSFVEKVREKYHRIDLLINNAGVSYPQTTKVATKDGFEMHMGVNHLGHFYLTKGLLDRLSNTNGSRIVIITSKLHEKGVIFLDDLNYERTNIKTNLYANSKLANAYFCRELARRTSVNVYSCCPGWVYTNLFRYHNVPFYKLILALPIAFIFMRTPFQGSQTAVFCATEPDLLRESGYMYRDCTKYVSKVKFDDTISQRLWEKSDELINEKLKLLT